MKHDILPPRETDLVQLLSQAKELEPDLVQHAGFIRELNGYCPGKADTLGRGRSSSIVGRTARFVRGIISRFAPDEQA